MSETKKARVRKIVTEERGIYKQFDDGTILLTGRVSYPWIGKPQKNTNKETGAETETYGLSLMLPKDTHINAMKACRDGIRKLEAQMIAKGMKGGKDRKTGKEKPFRYQAAKKFIKDADAVDPSSGDSLFFPKNPEYEGHWIVSARSQDQPRMRSNRIDPETGKPMRLTSAEALRLFTGGNYVSALIRPWPQDNDFGIRANAELLAVQFKSKGEPFGAGRLDDDDIDDSMDADEGDDDSGGWGDDDDDNDM